MKALVTTNTTSKTERVFLIGAQFSSRTAYEVQESLSELAELAKTAGGTVIDTGLQVLEKPHAATFIGSGKAEQFAVDCRSRDIDTVIFDDELSAKQIRNIEQALGTGHKTISESERKNIEIARKSIVAAKDIKEGEIFTEDNLTIKRPGNGISPMEWENIIGKVAKRDFQEEELIEL